MRGGEDDLKEIIDDIDLEDWLDWEAISYKRVGSGENLNLQHCPFCGDSRKKVFFHRAKKTGLCFHGSCNAHFNLFTFAREHIGADNKATVQHLKDYARQAGVARPKPQIVERAQTDGWELPDNVPLPTPDGHTHPFLLDRRITLETQALYGLRWCETGRWTYTDLDGTQRQMIFDGRVLIPVHDLDGTVRSFQGRDATGTAEKRYLFPATLPGTGRFLYGGHLAPGKKRLVICEGPFDVMATHQAISGHPDFRDTGVIGSFGLSIGMSDGKGGDDQLARLFKLREAGLKELTFLWDGERGAFLEAVKNGEKLLAHGFGASIGLLPPDRDPNEVDTATVRRAIEEAQRLSPLAAISWRLNPPYK